MNKTKPDYDNLRQYLAQQTDRIVLLTIDDIERIIEGSLPMSASKHSAWWSASGHPHAETWEESGYKAVNVRENLQDKRMEFAPIGQITRDNRIDKKVHSGIKTQLESAQIEVPEPDINSITIEGYTFHNLPFKMSERHIPSPFLEYSGRMVREMLQKSHYSSLSAEVMNNYKEFLDADIKEFMNYLVASKDAFYKRFLNKNGESDFCRFKIADSGIAKKRGLYLYTYDNRIKYLGRCRDSFGKRFGSNGYGDIAAINCYKHGQSTNTHMNSLMNTYGDDIKIFVCALTDENEIKRAEKHLINLLDPVWNRSR